MPHLWSESIEKNFWIPFGTNFGHFSFSATSGSRLAYVIQKWQILMLEVNWMITFPYLWAQTETDGQTHMRTNRHIPTILMSPSDFVDEDNKLNIRTFSWCLWTISCHSLALVGHTVNDGYLAIKPMMWDSNFPLFIRCFVNLNATTTRCALNPTET